MTDPDPVPRLNAALEGRYRIERELGSGGMATVYVADDVRHQRKVALKVLKPELTAVVGAVRVRGLSVGTTGDRIVGPASDVYSRRTPGGRSCHRGPW